MGILFNEAPDPLKVVAVTIPETLILVAVAAPNMGVTRVGLVANTFTPVPVLSVSAVDKFDELKEPNEVAVLTDVIAPVRLGILVVDVAVPVKLAVIVPALKLPEPSLATIADAVLALVALDVTVNVDAPD